MLHDQIITFLESTVIFLLLTNAVSVIVAAYAVSVATGVGRDDVEAAVAQRANAALSGLWPSRGA